MLIHARVIVITLQNTPGPHIAVLKDVDTMYGGAGRSAVFGDGMATLHKRCGTVGVVCDGSIRDVDGIKRVGLPVWATGEVSGHGRFVIKAFNKVRRSKIEIIHERLTTTTTYTIIGIIVQERAFVATIFCDIFLTASWGANVLPKAACSAPYRLTTLTAECAYVATCNGRPLRSQNVYI